MVKTDYIHFRIQCDKCIEKKLEMQENNLEIASPDCVRIAMTMLLIEIVNNLVAMAIDEQCHCEERSDEANPKSR
jgi:hypothetical protein